MAYGVQIYRPSGALLWDSNGYERLQMLLPPIVAAAGSGATVSYPALAGRSVQAQALITPANSTGGGAASEPSVDFALGYPRVTVPARPFDQFVIVFLL